MLLTDLVISSPVAAESPDEKSGRLCWDTGGITSWTDVTPVLTSNYFDAFITDIEISSSNPDHIWVTYSGYFADLKVKESVDGGINWLNNNANLPNLPVNCIEYEQGSNDGVYI